MDEELNEATKTLLQAASTFNAAAIAAREASKMFEALGDAAVVADQQIRRLTEEGQPDADDRGTAVSARDDEGS